VRAHAHTHACTRAHARTHTEHRVDPITTCLVGSVAWSTVACCGQPLHIVDRVGAFLFCAWPSFACLSLAIRCSSLPLLNVPHHVTHCVPSQPNPLTLLQHDLDHVTHCVPSQPNPLTLLQHDPDHVTHCVPSQPNPLTLLQHDPDHVTHCVSSQPNPLTLLQHDPDHVTHCVSSQPNPLTLLQHDPDQGAHGAPEERLFTVFVPAARGMSAGAGHRDADRAVQDP
jgi:hypothetical protein